MRPMTEDEYEQDGIIKNPLDIPTTIARVVAFGATRCNDSQKQTIELLVHWLRDDYEQSHCEEIESLAADTQVRLANAIEEAANKPATQNNHFEYVDKKETNIDKNYGPNIENNGTLRLPDEFKRTLSNF
jgi:hypothetical protein